MDRTDDCVMLRSLRGAVNPLFCQSRHGRPAASLNRPVETEPGDLGPWLRTVLVGRTSSFHASIGSTQDEARRLARAGAPHGHLVWANTQTSGRGRMARRWYSAPGSGLWFSVVLRPGRPAAAVVALPLATGAAVGAALDRFAPGSIRLKWPNDVLLGGRKVAGILVEAQTHGGVVDHVVVGIGINLRRPREGFDAEIGETAAALAEVAPGASPPAVLAAVLEELENAYEELLAHGPATARQGWLALADTVGRDVVANAAGEVIRGRAVDLDEAGNLVVERDGKRHVVTYGEVEHLR